MVVVARLHGVMWTALPIEQKALICAAHAVCGARLLLIWIRDMTRGHEATLNPYVAAMSLSNPTTRS